MRTCMRVRDCVWQEGHLGGLCVRCELFQGGQVGKGRSRVINFRTTSHELPTPL